MNIIVGWADRPEGQAALERAIEEAGVHGATLHIVRTMGEVLTENPAQAQQWAGEVDRARRQGDALVQDLAGRGIEATVDVDTGSLDASTTLLNAARDLGATLIVIGIRRRSPVGKLVLGSVSQQVLLRADCPVLAVKANEN